MYAIYREREETLILDEGYWTTEAAALKECSVKPQRHRLRVRQVPMTRDDFEVAGGRIERVPLKESRHVYEISAYDIGAGQRQCIALYTTLHAAMKKRRKYAADGNYNEWIIDRGTVALGEWDDFVGSDTESV